MIPVQVPPGLVPFASGPTEAPDPADTETTVVYLLSSVRALRASGRRPEPVALKGPPVADEKSPSCPEGFLSAMSAGDLNVAVC